MFPAYTIVRINLPDDRVLFRPADISEAYMNYRQAHQMLLERQAQHEEAIFQEWVHRAAPGEIISVTYDYSQLSVENNHTCITCD